MELNPCNWGDGEMGNDEIVEDLGPAVQFSSQLS